ncbi:hypothetical protein GS907_24635 [Rhodococcus hoagii]|nr:hypothetical protein [Prescottella equi]
METVENRNKPQPDIRTQVRGHENTCLFHAEVREHRVDVVHVPAVLNPAPQRDRTVDRLHPRRMRHMRSENRRREPAHRVEDVAEQPDLDCLVGERVRRAVVVVDVIDDPFGDLWVEQQTGLVPRPAGKLILESKQLRPRVFSAEEVEQVESAAVAVQVVLELTRPPVDQLDYCTFPPGTPSVLP